MRSFLKQPLLHFLLIGLGFFILFNVFGENEDIDSKTIVVNKDVLMNYFQYQSRAFNEEVFEEKLASMPSEELEELIDNYVREEVLYREAMAMGLDKEDFIIKRRMIQKVEFISQGISEAATDPSDEDIQKYYEANKESYFVPPMATFTHVFFDFEKWKPDQAKAKAEAEVAFLNRNNFTFNQAPSRGDRFFYHTNYVERDVEYIKSHFGAQMTSAIFEAEPSGNTWIGPFPSEYGYHVVMLTMKQVGRYPELEEVRSRVTEDTRRENIKKLNDDTIQGIIDGYDVRVEYDVEAEAKAEGE